MDILISRDGDVTRSALTEASSALSEGAVVWIDVGGPDLDGLQEIQRLFGLHDLAIETCRDELNRPHMVDYDGHMFIVLNPLAGFDGDQPRVEELDLFLGERFLITVHRNPVAVISEMLRRCAEKPSSLARGVDFVFYLLMDHLSDQYFGLLEQLDDRIDDIEDRVVTDPDQSVLNQVFLLKRQLVHLRRVVGPQREIFAMLNNREFPFIQQQTLVYFRDVHEHLIRLYEMADSMRDLLSNLLDAYLSTVSNRMNEVMKALTLIATIFMPLTLLGSIYGMNFKYMPELEWKYGYFVLLGLMAAIAGGMIRWFRKRKWL